MQRSGSPYWPMAAALAALLLLFAIRGWPWVLHGYDQAKQAFVPVEIVTTGHWLVQHTPDGLTATKPPLLGWIATLVYRATGSWQAAWWMPSLFAAALLLLVLTREGERAAPGMGGWVAAGTFGLNMLTIRIATLVRTDMLLTLWIALAGLHILHVVERGGPWRMRERLQLGALVLLSLLTKGPVIYAVLLPGVALYALLRRGQNGRAVWAGVLIWTLPLAGLLGWAAAAIWADPAFYRDVVLREFLGNFTAASAAAEAGAKTVTQPFWFYLPHLLHKAAPWSLLLVGLAFTDRAWRARVARDPGALWLACWILGALVAMSLVPAKRVDRIFPILPAAALLLARHWPSITWPLLARHPARAARVLWAATLLLWGAYATSLALGRGRPETIQLRDFCNTARETSAHAGWRIAAAGPQHDAVLCYLRLPSFLDETAGRAAWTNGALDALVVNAATWTTWGPPTGATLHAASPDGAGHTLLFVTPSARAVAH